MILKQLFGSLPPFLHDKFAKARGVVGCCEGAVSQQTCLICFAILALPSCLLARSALFGFACLVCFATPVHLATYFHALFCFALLAYLLWMPSFAFLCKLNTRNSTKRRLKVPLAWKSGVQLIRPGLAWACLACLIWLARLVLAWEACSLGLPRFWEILKHLLAETAPKSWSWVWFFKNTRT